MTARRAALLLLCILVLAAAATGCAKEGSQAASPSASPQVSPVSESEFVFSDPAAGLSFHFFTPFKLIGAQGAVGPRSEYQAGVGAFESKTLPGKYGALAIVHITGEPLESAAPSPVAPKARLTREAALIRSNPGRYAPGAGKGAIVKLEKPRLDTVSGQDALIVSCTRRADGQVSWNYRCLFFAGDMRVELIAWAGAVLPMFKQNATLMTGTLRFEP